MSTSEEREKSGATSLWFWVRGTGIGARSDCASLTPSSSEYGAPATAAQCFMASKVARLSASSSPVSLCKPNSAFVHAPRGDRQCHEFVPSTCLRGLRGRTPQAARAGHGMSCATQPVRPRRWTLCLTCRERRIFPGSASSPVVRSSCTALHTPQPALDAATAPRVAAYALMLSQGLRRLPANAALAWMTVGAFCGAKVADALGAAA